MNKKRGRPFKISEKAVTMNISLSYQVRERLEAESERTGQSMAEIIRISLERYFS